MGPHDSSQAAALKALSVALQHPALAGDQQDICRVLQVCQSWRKAVQQSSANVTDVVYSKWLPPSEGHTTEYTSELPQFSHWLASNAGLVRSISIDLKQNYTVDSRTLDMTDQVLSLGLRAAAAAHQTQTAHLCSGAACPAGLRLFRLQSFTCISDMEQCLISSALPAATLTELRIEVPNTQRVFQALASLSNLQVLQLFGSYGDGFGERCLQSISKLSRLTDLQVAYLQDTDHLHLLPEQLKKLQLRIQGRYGEVVQLHLAHLTELQVLSAVTARRVDAAGLPQQLQQVDIACCCPALSALHVRTLQQLQHLTVHWSEDLPEDLLILKQLPAAQYS